MVKLRDVFPDFFFLLGLLLLFFYFFLIFSRVLKIKRRD